MRVSSVIATMALLLSMVLSTSAPFADAQPTEYQPPPYLQRLFPDKGHIVGGTTVTIYGGGFRRGGGLTVRFSAESGEVDEVPATYVDAGRITCVTPARLAPHDAHVAVSNNGVAFSSFPLVDLDEGTYLHFAFVDEVPRGTWTLDVAAGSHRGGTTVTLFDENHRMSTRRDDKNFLPGAHLFCRFGNARNASAVDAFNVSVADKTAAHPRFGVGYHRGYVIDDVNIDESSSPHAVRYEGITLTLVRGRSYAFRLDASTAGFPFFITAAEPREWREDAFVGEVIDAVTNSRSEGASVVTYVVAASAPDTLYYACGAFRAMGGVIRVLDEAETRTASPATRLLARSPRTATPCARCGCRTTRSGASRPLGRAHGRRPRARRPSGDGVRDQRRRQIQRGVRRRRRRGRRRRRRRRSRERRRRVPRARGARCHVHVLRRERVRGPTKVRSGVHALGRGPGVARRPESGGASLLAERRRRFERGVALGAYFYHRELEETHSFSDAYDDFGRRKAHKVNQSLVALEAAANATAAVALLADGDPANDATSAPARNDLVVNGTYTGGGVAWFEVVVDGVDGTNFTSVRWRKHFGCVNTTSPWARTNVSVPADDRVLTPDEVEGVDLGDGLVAGFVRLGAHHAVGDRWTFRAFSGFPGISSVSTSHDEPRIEARGPMEGLTEVVARGSGFFPGRGQLLCRFADPSDAARAGNAEVSGVVSTVEAAAYVDARGDEYDAEYVGGTGADSVYRKMRCVTERHPPALGGREALATLAPCVNKTVTVSHDGGGSFSRSDVAFFLFCDVHVSVSGSDVVGTGTPGNPYKTLQRGVEAALAAPRFPETKYQRTFFETAAAAAYGAEGFGVSAFGTAREARKGAARRGGYGYVLNRDRLRLGAGTYAGNGNRGVHPLGKMVEVEAKTPGSVTVDCEDDGVGATVHAGDRHAEHASGAISMSGVHAVNCNDRSAA